MVEINIAYQGNLRCVAEHQPSSTRLITDAPKDNHGQGESFSPTDLVATALGTCMLTIMGIAAKSLNIDLSETNILVRKEMVVKPIRRIGKLEVVISVAAKLDDAQKQKLIDAALSCPVHQSMHPDVQMPVEFIWVGDVE
jgi:putative redox protein